MMMIIIHGYYHGCYGHHLVYIIVYYYYNYDYNDYECCTLDDQFGCLKHPSSPCAEDQRAACRLFTR